MTRPVSRAARSPAPGDVVVVDIGSPCERAGLSSPQVASLGDSDGFSQRKSSVEGPTVLVVGEGPAGAPRVVGAIEAVVGAAFSHDPGVAHLPRLIRESEQYVPELELVARVDDAVVGHTMISRVDL